MKIDWKIIRNWALGEASEKEKQEVERWGEMRVKGVKGEGLGRVVVCVYWGGREEEEWGEEKYYGFIVDILLYLINCCGVKEGVWLCVIVNVGV